MKTLIFFVNLYHKPQRFPGELYVSYKASSTTDSQLTTSCFLISFDSYEPLRWLIFFSTTFLFYIQQGTMRNREILTRWQTGKLLLGSWLVLLIIAWSTPAICANKLHCNKLDESCPQRWDHRYLLGVQVGFGSPHGLLGVHLGYDVTRHILIEGGFGKSYNAVLQVSTMARWHTVFDDGKGIGFGSGFSAGPYQQSQQKVCPVCFPESNPDPKFRHWNLAFWWNNEIYFVKRSHSTHFRFFIGYTSMINRGDAGPCLEKACYQTSTHFPYIGVDFGLLL
jgi:hypothetical protein